MNESEIIQLAERFLDEHGIAFVKQGCAVWHGEGRVEVRFLVPEALDPNAVVDPPDVIVLVYLNSRHAELVPQM